MLRRDFSAHQAFSYITEKQRFAPKRKFLHEGLTLLALFSLLSSLLALHMPKGWFFHKSSFLLLFFWIASFLLMGCKTFLAMEVIDYITHRYLEHPNFLTRYSPQARQNQQAHWFHHMIQYPGNAYFQQTQVFKRTQKGKAPRHWIFPLACFTGFSLLTNGFTLECLFLFFLAIVHCKLSTIAHRLFHLKQHFLSKSRYFQWLADIHLLHHFDQQKNYMMLHPLMDILFGTYLSPKGRASFIKSLLQNYDITAADFINWHHLLTEATPIEYAVAISSSQKHPEVVEKVKNLIQCLHQFTKEEPFYQKAYLLRTKLILFLNQVQFTSLKD